MFWVVLIDKSFIFKLFLIDGLVLFYIFFKDIFDMLVMVMFRMMVVKLKSLLGEFFIFGIDVIFLNGFVFKIFKNLCNNYLINFYLRYYVVSV